jgi:hypothetical protein
LFERFFDVDYDDACRPMCVHENGMAICGTYFREKRRESHGHQRGVLTQAPTGPRSDCLLLAAEEFSRSPPCSKWASQKAV